VAEPGPFDAAGGAATMPEPARRILDAADACLERRALMDEFAEPYRRTRRTAQLALNPVFRIMVTDFAAAFSVLVEAVDEAEHPHAHFIPVPFAPSAPGQPRRPLPFSWRPLIADVRLLAALEAGIAGEREHLRALALERFRRWQQSHVKSNDHAD
jgi:hypothetical protein